MKKFAVVLFAAAMVLAFALPASAIEHKFGGYFRWVGASYNNLSGQDKVDVTGSAGDLQLMDSRTRLYYTAKFSDDFKFVNKFEIDWTYGGPDGGGDIGTDGKIFEVKNSYLDFNYWNDLNFKIGLQGTSFGRGAVFDDDFAGIMASYVQPGRKLIVPFVWIKAIEGGIGINANKMDVDGFGLNPFWRTGNWVINPFGLLWYSDNATELDSDIDDLTIYYLGLSVDYKFKNGSAWGSFIYQGGETEDATTRATTDVSAYAFMVGGDTNVGPVGLSAQFNWFSGDDDPLDGDRNDYFILEGPGYNNTSELLGKGFLFSQRPAEGIWDDPNNVWMIGGAAKYNIVKSLQLKADLWYSELVEEKIIGGSKSLGTEVDLKVTWKMVNKLKLEAVGAYLFAGDGFYDGTNAKDPWELGARLSLSF